MENQIKKNGHVCGGMISLADFVLLSVLDPSEAAGVEATALAGIGEWREKSMRKDFYQRCHRSYEGQLKNFLMTIKKH